jgi:hypothetical protein
VHRAHARAARDGGGIEIRVQFFASTTLRPGAATWSAPALLSSQMDAAAFARPLLRLRLPAALPLPLPASLLAVAMMKRSAAVANSSASLDPRP